MASESSTTRRHHYAPSPQEGACLVVRINYHPRLHADYPDPIIASIEDFVRDAYRDIAESKGGKTLYGNGDGGTVLFPIVGNESFDNCCEAALQMVEMVPALDADFRLPNYKDRSIRIRVVCDASTFADRLMRLERLGAEDRVTITDRFFRYLAQDLQSRFAERSFSKELGVGLLTTSPLDGDGADRMILPPPQFMQAGPSSSDRSAACKLGAFLSHSSRDRAEAEAICRGMEAAGIRCWIAPRDILPGTAWAEAIIDGIEQCRVMVLVLSEHANDSPQVLREVELASNRRVPVIPVRIRDKPPARALEYYISGTHWLDAFDPPLEKHIKTLVTVVERLPGRGKA